MVSNPALVTAGHRHPSKVVIYVHTADSGSSNSSVAATPPAPANPIPPFGSIYFANNVLRKGPAPESPQIGYSLWVDASGGPNVYFSNVYVLTSGYTGSLTIQGEASFGVPGEVAVTGGTGDFRFARGYLISVQVSGTDTTNLVFMSTFYLKFD